MTTRLHRLHALRVGMVGGVAAAVIAGAGCASKNEAPSAPAAGSLRPLTVPAGGNQADADRAALARFVGVWDFQGWADDRAGARREASGRAAGTIESEHFVMLQLQSSAGEMAGRAMKRSGSLLLGSEPGLGVTLTAWGDASPAVSRLIGSVAGNGGEFTFTEARTPSGVHRVSMDVVFETDDRWVATVRDVSAGGEPVVARYTFSRVAEPR